MSRTYAFVQVDVFTDQVFGGNPLAVFLDPVGLSDADMQAIAREMNLSETTFVFPPDIPECAARVRIFTPSRELPFAGHPTVGTAWVLAVAGRLPADQSEVALQEGIGRVPVRLVGDVRRPSTVWMRHRDADFSPFSGQPAAIASALGLNASDLLPEYPICTGSTGLPFLYVPLRSPEAVDRARPNYNAIRNACQAEYQGVFVFAADPERGPGRAYSRMFAGDSVGVDEDPATGSASGPLGAYVAERGMLDVSASGEIVSLQGNLMGRPSLVHIRVRLEDGRARDLEVGGGVVPVLEGVLTIPATSS